MITLTDKAQETLLRLIESADKPLTGLRIGVNSGGCSGLQYQLALVEKPEPDDHVVEIGKTILYLEPTNAEILIGTVIDFVESLEGAGFTFDNPNAGAKCSCGKSFAA
ncbi:MAG: iron-sulfur cluster assembly accessory protein [Hyphomicrobiales bacterium]|nr:MAG: iron-sulfur cluster assembly accessory protein [Hyphomicrobiales bacterium]